MPPQLPVSVLKALDPEANRRFPWKLRSAVAMDRRSRRTRQIDLKNFFPNFNNTTNNRDICYRYNGSTTLKSRLARIDTLCRTLLRRRHLYDCIPTLMLEKIILDNHVQPCRLAEPSNLTARRQNPCRPRPLDPINAVIYLSQVDTQAW